MARSSGKLSVGTNVVTTKAGFVTFISIIASSADATVTLYNADTTGEAVTANELLAFKIDVSLNGFQGGGNINDPIKFSDGLVVKVEGTSAVAYVAYTKGPRRMMI